MKKNIISILIVFLQIAMVIALIFLFGLNIKIEESWILIFTLIGSLIFSVYFHVITHELGHLIFGLMSGFQFVSFHFLVIYGIVICMGRSNINDTAKLESWGKH